MQGLGYLPGHMHSQAMGVSADGRVAVGYSKREEGSPRHAVAWTEADGILDLGLPLGGEWSEAHAASADGSVIVGDWGTPSSGHRGFVWNPTDGFLDLGDDVFWVSDVSDDGSVVVGGKFIWGDGWTGAEAFGWTATEGLVGLGNLSTPPNDHGEAFGVSGDGSIVVGHGGSLQPLLWDAVHGTRALRGELLAEGIDVSGGLLMAARDVAFDGDTIRIVGDQNWMATYVIPEPCSLWLAMAAWIGVLAPVFRRPKHR